MNLYSCPRTHYVPSIDQFGSDGYVRCTKVGVKVRIKGKAITRPRAQEHKLAHESNLLSRSATSPYTKYPHPLPPPLPFQLAPALAREEVPRGKCIIPSHPIPTQIQKPIKPTQEPVEGMFVFCVGSSRWIQPKRWFPWSNICMGREGQWGGFLWGGFSWGIGVGGVR